MMKSYFEENLNKAVFSTKDVVLNGKKIRYINHDIDDDWQFFEKTDVKVEEIMVVSLSQIINLDKGLIDLISLPAGTESIRNSANDSWEPI